MSSETSVLVLGACTVVPEAEGDTACLLLNGNHLVDTGWNAAVNMKRYGEDPMAVDTVFITHCHHDHYIGLPQLLFYHAMRRRERPDKPPLTLVGPKPDIIRVARLAVAFLRHEEFPDAVTPPRVVALQAGDRMETDRFDVTTAPTVHPVVGLCYRFRDTLTGKVVVVTGDTARHEPLARHAAGADLLIHEASRGPVESDPNAHSGHAGALDAAAIARLAQVGQLGLVHYPTDRRADVEAAARSVFPQARALREGDRIRL